MKKSILLILTLFVTLTSIVACDKKKDGGKTNRFRDGFRNDRYLDNNYRRGNNSQSGTWGVIYNNSQSMTNILNQFMGNVTNLGFVSGSMNASTGVMFRGQVNGNTGKMDILVWDDYANQDEDPIFWTMNIADVRENGNSIRIVLQDDMGSVTFDGTISGSEYRGRVSFNNTDGQSGQLGQFAIDGAALFND
jgi:hypothetical protein